VSEKFSTKIHQPRDEEEAECDQFHRAYVTRTCPTTTLRLPLLRGTEPPTEKAPAAFPDGYVCITPRPERTPERSQEWRWPQGAEEQGERMGKTVRGPSCVPRQRQPKPNKYSVTNPEIRPRMVGHAPMMPAHFAKTNAVTIALSPARDQRVSPSSSHFRGFPSANFSGFCPRQVISQHATRDSSVDPLSCRWHKSAG